MCSAQNFYSPSIDQNILHPDVIVDTDNLSDCSSSASLKSGKRKLSTSTDGDSTNYELIEYLKRREKRDEELLKRMDAREERFMNLLERTVIAIEQLAAGKAQAVVASKATETETATKTDLDAVSPATELPLQCVETDDVIDADIAAEESEAESTGVEVDPETGAATAVAVETKVVDVENGVEIGAEAESASNQT